MAMGSSSPCFSGVKLRSTPSLSLPKSSIMVPASVQSSKRSISAKNIATNKWQIQTCASKQIALDASTSMH